MTLRAGIAALLVAALPAVAGAAPAADPEDPDALYEPDPSEEHEPAPAPFVRDDERDAGLRVGPFLGATYVHAGGADFSSPLIGGSIRKGAYALFVAEGGRLFRGSGGDDGRIGCVGLRVGPATGLFFQALALDARRVVVERGAWSHRALGGTAGLGWQLSGRTLHGSVAAGIGGFDLSTPERVESASSIGFSLSGHAGVAF